MASAVDALIPLIYEAALDPRRWCAFLKAYSNLTRASAAVLLYHDIRQRRGTAAPSVGVDPEAIRQYNAHYAACDPWFYATEEKGLLKTGVAIISEEIVPRSKLLQSEYYNDFARRFDLTRTLSAVIRRDGQLTSSISALRPDEGRSFGEEERRVIQHLLPHLYRAIQVHRRMVDLENSNHTLLQVFDYVASGIIVTRADGTIAFANRAAAHIFEQRDGLSSKPDGLTAASRREHRMLRSLIHSAATATGKAGTAPGGAMSVSRPSLKRPLAVLVAPLRTALLNVMLPECGMAVVFVSTADEPVEADSGEMQRLWGLTATEAAVAMKLADGCSVSEIAQQLGIASGTVRWHVKHVFAKTGTRRQAELVKTLMLSVATVRRMRP